MDFVTPQIAIGSRADAEDPAVLSAHGIDALLSLTQVARPTGVLRQLALDVKDREVLASDVIDDAVAFLKDQVENGRRILVHCEMGISRSPALVACYLHEGLGMDLDAAIDHVRSRRPVAEPHSALVDSMRTRYLDDGAEIDLSGNENPLGPSPRAIAAIRRAVTQLHRYPDKAGTALRGLLARQLGMAGDEIVLGNGSCELIDLAARACLEPASEVLIPQPAFPAYRSAAVRAGARVVPVPMHDGQYRVDELLERLSPATRLVIIASPHNPTGALFRRDELDRLRAELPASTWLLLDEAYRDYAPQGGLADLRPNVRRGESVIVLRSLSKLHGLAGLRIGYGIAPRPMAKRLTALTQQFNTSSLAQIAATAALEDDAHRESTLAANARGLAQLERGMAALGIEYLPSAANFVLMRAGDGGVGHFAAHGIKVKDMDRYGMPGYIRVSVGRFADNQRFLAALAALCCAGASRKQSIHA